MYVCNISLFCSIFQAALSPPTGVLRRESSDSLSPEGDDFFHSVEDKEDDDWDTDLEMDGKKVQCFHVF